MTLPPLPPESSTLSPLPSVLSRGLVAVSAFGLLSFCCSSTLFIYLTYRLITWRFKSGTDAPVNQFLLLIYNLLLADIQQSLAFLLNISALRNNAIIVGTSTCWAQGWFVSTGDLASSVFICAIAVHTFFGVVKGHRVSNWAFRTGILLCWLFVYALGALGPILHKDDFYVRASAWCWINNAYSHERLWLHYIWIFICMFLTILLYLIIFLFLRLHPVSTSQSLVHGATPLMILYPLIYTICTAPLAIGRIYALAGHGTSLGYFCVAGTMIACNGWLDVLLYASTRADIVFSEHPPSEETGVATFGWLGRGRGSEERLGTVTVIEGNTERSGSRLGGLSRKRSGSTSGESLDNLYVGVDIAMGGIGVKENVEVTVENVPSTSRFALTRKESGNWDDETSSRSRGGGKSFDNGSLES